MSKEIDITTAADKKPRFAMGFELPPEVMEAIVGREIDFNYVRDFRLDAPLSGEAFVTMSISLKPEQLKKLKAIIEAGKANL